VNTQPKIGVIFLGRKRPGFDAEWRVTVKERVRAFLDNSKYGFTIPEDNVPDDGTLRRVLAQCRNEGANALVVLQPTISDGRLAPILAQVWDDPVVFWATPERPEVETISANSLVGNHMFAATLRHLNRPFEFMYRHPDESAAAQEFDRAVAIVATASRLRHGKVGLVGYHAPGFIDFHCDPVALNDWFGTQLYHESIHEFRLRVESQTEDDVRADVEAAKELGLPYRGTDEPVLPLQSRFMLAFRELMREEGLAGLAIRDWPDLPAIFGAWPYFALSRLVSEGAPIVMEGDVDGAVCSVIAEGLGIGPVYITDLMEFDEQSITIWHGAAPPFQLCEPIGDEKGPTLSLHFNNKLPALVEATIRGDLDVTLFQIWRCDDTYRMMALEGRTRKPGRHYLATNGIMEVEGVNVRDWFDDMLHSGMPHHGSLIQGHHGRLLKRFCRQFGIEFISSGPSG
jgi:L-fucose isomerase-like protein